MVTITTQDSRTVRIVVCVTIEGGAMYMMSGIATPIGMPGPMRTIVSIARFRA